MLILIALSPLGLSSQEFTIYLTRHAEKQLGENPNLTECGELRAHQLSQILALENITSVYSTSYNRTLETAYPTAKLNNVSIKHYSPKLLDLLAVKLLQAKQNVLVVGHSNTTPELADFIAENPLKSIREDEFQYLYQIKVIGDTRTVSILKQPLTCQ